MAAAHFIIHHHPIGRNRQHDPDQQQLNASHRYQIALMGAVEWIAFNSATGDGNFIRVDYELAKLAVIWLVR